MTLGTLVCNYKTDRLHFTWTLQPLGQPKILQALHSVLTLAQVSWQDAMQVWNRDPFLWHKGVLRSHPLFWGGLGWTPATWKDRASLYLYIPVSGSVCCLCSLLGFVVHTTLYTFILQDAPQSWSNMLVRRHIWGKPSVMPLVFIVSLDPTK